MNIALLFIFLTGGACWDLKTAKIPNWWILLGVVSFITAKVMSGSFTGSMESESKIMFFLIRISFYVILLFPLFLLHMVGAGDIKMMALIGGYLSISQGFQVIFYGLAVSAAWSLLYMIQKKILKKRIIYFFIYFSQLFKTGPIVPYYQAERDGNQIAFCFVPFLWCGLCMWIVKRGGIM
ncbi:MAG: prepilin peptidase [Clostridium sp.]